MTEAVSQDVFGVCNALELRFLPLQRYSTEVSDDHLAIYGNVSIPRAYCDQCQCYAFVIGGALQCCGHFYKVEPTHYRRMSEPEYTRRVPPKSDQKIILRSQQNCCFYCNRGFGSKVYLGARSKILKPVWDHLVPYYWQANNATTNFVASCQPCNKWKGAIMFNTIEEAQVYVHQKWEEAERKTKEKVRVLRYGVPTNS